MCRTTRSPTRWVFYERYSDVVYGIEAIVLWPRIFMVIPDEARNQVRESEALFHFSLNLLVVGSLSFALYIAMAVAHWQTSNTSFSIALPWVMIPAASALSAWFGWWQLPGAAAQRGGRVKAVFDL